MEGIRQPRWVHLLRGNPRLRWSVIFLCLPTLAVIGLAIRFAMADLPQIVEGERNQVKASVREVAQDLLEAPATADFAWRKGTGLLAGEAKYAEEFPATLNWKDWPLTAPAAKKEKWGYFPRPEGALVWVRDTAEGRDANVVYGRQTDFAERDYRTLFWVGGGSALLVLVIITFFGAKSFIDSVQEREDFMAATAHDLTTPLVGLRFMIGRDDAEAKVLTERLVRLVENVKDFMRLGGRRRQPEAKPFDLIRAYEEAYALFREDYRDLFNGTDVERSVNSNTQTRKHSNTFLVLADETMTVQILWNLLGNDLKYAAPYGSVKAVFSVGEETVSVSFADEGQGMTPRQMKKAFDRYYRAKTVLQSGKGGFGIGLCTAREFARAMGGDLTVRANEPKGCVFTLTLPRA